MRKPHVKGASQRLGGYDARGGCVMQVLECGMSSMERFRPEREIGQTGFVASAYETESFPSSQRLQRTAFLHIDRQFSLRPVENDTAGIAGVLQY